VLTIKNTKNTMRSRLFAKNIFDYTFCDFAKKREMFEFQFVNKIG